LLGSTACQQPARDNDRIVPAASPWGRKPGRKQLAPCTVVGPGRDPAKITIPIQGSEESGEGSGNSGSGGSGSGGSSEGWDVARRKGSSTGGATGSLTTVNMAAAEREPGRNAFRSPMTSARL
jgi:hypothetical protein